MAAAMLPEPRNAFEKKLYEVTFWLKNIYGDMPIPWYEVNERTVDILHEVMECQKERDKDVTLLIDYMKEKTAKFEAEAKYWQDILEEGLGLSEHSLSEEAAADLADLVDSAEQLEIEDTSLINFYSAINNLTSELYETKFKNDEMEVKVKSLSRKLMKTLTMEQQLKEDIKKVEEFQEGIKAKAEVRSKNLKFLEDKSKDLKIQISDAENELVVRGLDQSLVHEALVKSSEELAALRKEIEPLKEERASYLDLPPSIPLARVMVEEARQKLKALDDELSKEIEAVPFQYT